MRLHEVSSQRDGALESGERLRGAVHRKQKIALL